MADTAYTDGVTLVVSSWLNDVNTRTYNGLSSVAGTNTVTATGPTTFTAYAAKQCWLITPAVTNTGATTLNISSVGARNVFFNGAACSGGELVANVPTLLIDDGTRLNIVGSLPATQAQQEAGSSNSVFVTPGRQQFHPSAAKMWAFVTYSGGTPTLVASYNVTSITDTGVGQLTITFTTAFTTGSYATATDSANSTSNVACDSTVTKNAGSCLIDHFETTAPSLTDPLSISVVAFGDQP